MDKGTFELIMNTDAKLSGEDVMKLDIISKLLEESKENITLNIMMGISGSGKSTYINRNKKSGDVVISPDDIRRDITGSVSDQSKNTEVFSIANDRLKKSKSNTYFDATNLSLRSLRNILNNARQFSKINIYIMTASKNVDLCKRRVEGDISSGKDRSNVPEKVIEDMHKRFMQFVQNLKANIDTLKKEYGENRIEVKLI